KKIEEQEVVFLMDRFGYCKTIDLPTYERNQEAVHEENKYIIHCMNTGRLSIFTDTGQLHMVKVLDVPFGRFRDKGTPIDNISNYTSSKEQMVLVESKLDLSGKDVFMGSSDGMCKLVEGDEFDVAKKTTAATKLNAKAALMNVTIVDGTETVIIETDKGYFLRFPISEIPKKKKTAVGVRGIKVGKDDKIIGIHILKEGEEKYISRKGAEVALHRIHLAHRDGKGTKK
ncbi:MAG: DNA topoisomerase, partial [Lachnospiraceae bacterium]|nr:DNA topoisomerase [Lachnospiraceae bacterium]